LTECEERIDLSYKKVSYWEKFCYTRGTSHLAWKTHEQLWQIWGVTTTCLIKIFCLSAFMFSISTPVFVNLLRDHLFGTPVTYFCSMFSL